MLAANSSISISTAPSSSTVSPLSAAFRFRYAEQQPEAFTPRGAKDTRSAYGLHAREMLLWLHQLQHARGKNVVFVGILERVTDEFNRHEFALQMEGAKTGRELPGIVDEIITMQWIDFGDGMPVRAFVCTAPKPLELSGEGPRRTARADREAAPRRADRQAHWPRRTQAVRCRPLSTPRANDAQTMKGD